MIKRLLVAALLCAPVFGDQVAVSKFGLLNNNSPSVALDPSEAQDLLNVDLSPGGLSIKKRSGYGLYKALGTGQAVHGLYHAFDSTGNDYQLVGSSTSLYAVVADGSPRQIVSTATLNSTWDCADTQGNSYCVDSNRDVFLRTDGSTSTTYGSPLGTMVESTPDRVVVAGVSSAPNTLFVSQSNTFTNFTPGVNPTDAFQEVIAAPGSRLTHIRWGCGKLLWWKDASFGYFDFDDQFTAQVKTVSDNIGTFDNTSAIDPGGRVWFRGQDGHTWMYDCSALTKESIDITPDVLIAGKKTLNSWNQTTAADFGAGSGFSTHTDTTTTSGSVILQGITDQFTNSANWALQSGAATYGSSLVELSTTSAASLILPFGLAEIKYSTVTTGNYTSWITQANIQFHSCSDGIIVGKYPCPEDLAGIQLHTSADKGYEAYVVMKSTDFTTESSGYFLFQLCKNTQLSDQQRCLTSLNFNETTIPTDILNHTLTLSYEKSSGLLTLLWDGVTQVTATDTEISTATIPGLIFQSEISAARNQGAYFGNFSVRSTTGTYYSAVHNAPNLTTWSNFNATTENDGTQSFFIRSSTNSFSTLSSTPSWTSQTNGSFIGISTGSYFQMRDDFSITTLGQNPTLDSFTVNWFEGSANDQAYMLYFDNAIWESVPFGTGQANNNYIFRYDLINNGWGLYNFGAGGMLSAANRLYFGDTTSGNIFIFGTGTSDNGTAIQSYWRSKSFTGGDPFLQTQLTNIDTLATKNQGTTLTATYTVETSTATSYSVNLSSTTQTIIENRKLLPSGKLGYTFDMKYGDTSATSAWELLGFRIGFTQQPYRPSL